VREQGTRGSAGVRRTNSLVALTLMFVFGLWLEGRLFPLTHAAAGRLAIADLGIGRPHFVARLMGVGRRRADHA
jgi:hypothetical protein